MTPVLHAESTLLKTVQSSGRMRIGTHTSMLLSCNGRPWLFLARYKKPAVTALVLGTATAC